MDKLEKVLVEAFARLTGKSKEEVLNLTKNAEGVELEAAEIKSVLDALVTEKIDKVKVDSGAKHLNDGLKKRERLLAAALGIASYTDFEDLTAQIKDKKGEGTASPELQKQIEKYKVENAALQKTVADKVASLDKQIAKLEHDSVYNEALSIAKNQAEKLGLAFSTDPVKRARQIELHAKAELADKNLKRVGKKIVFVDEEGDAIKDEMHVEITLDTHFEKSFNDAFDKASTNTTSSDVPNPNGGKGGGKHKFTAEDLKPARFQEVSKSLQGDKEKLTAYVEQFDAQF